MSEGNANVAKFALIPHWYLEWAMLGCRQRLQKPKHCRAARQMPSLHRPRGKEAARAQVRMGHTCTGSSRRTTLITIVVNFYFHFSSIIQTPYVRPEAGPDGRRRAGAESWHLGGGGLVAEDGLARGAIAGGGFPEVATGGGDLALQRNHTLR